MCSRRTPIRSSPMARTSPNRRSASAFRIPICCSASSTSGCAGDRIDRGERKIDTEDTEAAEENRIRFDPRVVGVLGVPYVLKETGEDRMDDLSAQLAALTERVQALEDELAIHRLIVRYGLAVDTCDAERSAAVFAADGG